jgi:hypothetical protein
VPTLIDSPILSGMPLTEMVIQGTLNADGTLELDQKRNLAPGRVLVHLQPALVLPEGDPFFDMLKGIWASREAAGLTPRSVEEVETQRQQLRDDSEQEIAEAIQLQNESIRLSDSGDSL